LLRRIKEALLDERHLPRLDQRPPVKDEHLLSLDSADARQSKKLLRAVCVAL